MNWYIVIKTIKGRRYYYRQKTWREGKHVRTLSQYIGPVEDDQPAPPPASPAEPSAVRPDAPPAAPAFDSADFEKAFELVMGEQSNGWEHHWKAHRRGPNLVVKDERIERVLGMLDIRWTHNETGAYYNPSSGKVNIPPEQCFMDKHGQTATQAFYVVLFHEAAHWTARHLDRRVGFDRMKYAREELVAELSAVALMQHFGLQLGAPGRHAKYFQVWLSRAGSQKAALAHARKHAAAAVQFILDRGRMQHDQNS